MRRDASAVCTGTGPAIALLPPRPLALGLCTDDECVPSRQGGGQRGTGWQVGYHGGSVWGAATARFSGQVKRFSRQVYGKRLRAWPTAVALRV